MLKSLIVISLLGLTLAGKGGYRYLTATPHITQTQVSTPVANIAAVQAPAAAPTAHTQHSFEKHFYYFTAPQEKLVPQQHAVQQTVLQEAPKKKLQVIFIKPPEDKSHERIAHNLVKQATEQQQTHIYVLSKEPDHAALARKVQHVQQISHTASKPEVHFVKYKSAADANRAQQAIIEKYETLGGKSSHYNGGAAHIISTRSDLAADHSNTETTQTSTDDAPVDKGYANNFLPSGIDVVPGSSYIPLALRT